METSKSIKGALVVEGHVQGLAITRSLGSMGIPVIVVDRRPCIARFSRYCGKFFRCPDYLSSDFIDFILKLGERENLQDWVIYPSNDFAVYNLSRNRRLWSGLYRSFVPSPEIFENIYDKGKLLNIAHRAGIDTPATFLPVGTDLSGFNLPFPVLLKGRYGLSFYKRTGRKIFVLQDPGSLRKRLTGLAAAIKPEEVMLQEVVSAYRDNRVFSYTAFSLAGDVKSYWMGEKVRQHPRRFGTATFCRSVYEEQLHQLGGTLLRALNYSGVAEIEFMRDARDGSFKLIEMNARTWLWVELARVCGVDFPAMIHRYLSGRDIDSRGGYRVDVSWIHLTTDLFFSLKGILGGKLKLREYINSLKGEKHFAVLSRSDWKPFAAEILLLPYLMLSR